MLRPMQTQTIQSNASIPRLAFSLAEVEVSTGLSRATLYRMVDAGTLRTVQHGRRRLVPAAELERLCGAEQEGVVCANAK
jgi:excisionase family DNA binding protein